LTRTNSPGDIHAVLFDLDGTLIDTVALIRESMRHATTQVLRSEIAEDELMKGVGTPLLAQMRALSEPQAEELVRVYREHNARVHDDLIAEYPGVEETLEKLASHGVPMGVVTSKSRAVAMRGLELFGLNGYFEVVVCSDDTQKHKPDPEPVGLAASLMGVTPDQTAFVGDSPFDVMAARAAGALAIAALWGVFGREALAAAEPDRWASDIREVVSIVMPGEWRDGDSRVGKDIREHRNARGL